MTRPIITRTRAEVYRLWLDALSSGHYTQEVGRLKRLRGFCCLGVLCDLAVRDGGPEWVDDYFLGAYTILPKAVRIFMGLTTLDVISLAKMNDSGIVKFPEIACHIADHIMPKALARP